MSLIVNFFAAWRSRLPFGLAFKRAQCISSNHAENTDWEAVEKKRFEHHPQNDSQFIFTANLSKCSNCGLHFVDTGFESRSFTHGK